MKKKFIEKSVVVAVLLLYAAIWYALRLPCPIRYILGIDCPGCGMTRAIVSLLKLDFAASFNYHPLVFTIPVILWIFFTDGNMTKNKAVNTAITVLLALSYIAVWLIRVVF